MAFLEQILKDCGIACGPVELRWQLAVNFRWTLCVGMCVYFPGAYRSVAVGQGFVRFMRTAITSSIELF